MQTTRLGRTGPIVSAIGLGCMGMSAYYGPRDEAEAVATLHRALDLGITFFDSADMYGQGHNEELVGRVLRPHRDRVVIATKFGNTWNAAGERTGVSGRPDYVRSACEASLRRLGVDVIDLYYQHRVDPNTPIEDTMGAMADLVHAGKVRHLGLSEASPQTIRRAHAVHPIAALQTEYSLWSREPEAEILPMLRELGIALVPYSPLGRGFLTGQVQATETLAADDWRRQNPRFEAENLRRNVAVLDRLGAIAARLGCTRAQLALAWVVAQGKGKGEGQEDIVPIPGTKRRTYLEDNVASLAVRLDASVLAEIDAVAPPGAFAGERYTASALRGVNL